MHASSGNPLATLMMMIPLIAVPALAIFGVPNLDALNGATGETASDESPSDDAADSAGPARLTETPGLTGPSDDDLGEGFLGGAGATNDPFLEGKSGTTRDGDRSADAAPDGLKRPRGKSSRSRSNAATNGSAMMDASSKDDSTLGAEDEMPFGDPPADKVGSDDAVRNSPRGRATGSRDTSDVGERSAPKDLRGAAARLKQLGIHDFQLSAGDTDQSFVFACRHVSPKNPRVVRRFEAEASDPQAAIEDVMKQVEAWQAER